MAVSKCCTKCGRCKSLSSEESSDLSLVTQQNESTMLGVDPRYLLRPREQGSIYNVSYGRNYFGTDSGEVCVVKWPRSDHYCDKDNHFYYMQQIVDVAAEVIYNFLDQVDTRGYNIILNKPKTWKSVEPKGKSRTVMVEPYISGFKKFNSNTGWVRDNDRTYNKVVQALSHFSYVWSSGRFVLCDLQGGVREDKTIVLTDPVITSQKALAYGCTDMGQGHINMFFKNHECSSLCAHMAQPKDKKIFFRPVKSTVFSSGNN